MFGSGPAERVFGPVVPGRCGLPYHTGRTGSSGFGPVWQMSLFRFRGCVGVVGRGTVRGSVGAVPAGRTRRSVMAVSVSFPTPVPVPAAAVAVGSFVVSEAGPTWRVTEVVGGREATVVVRAVQVGAPSVEVVWYLGAEDPVAVSGVRRSV